MVTPERKREASEGALPSGVEPVKVLLWSDVTEEIGSMLIYLVQP